MTQRATRQAGFTIVELLIVIVVIGILAAITVVAYNGVQERAQEAKRDSDLSQYYKAIIMARANTGKVLGEITNSYWSLGACTSATRNPDGIEPKDLPKSHACWTQYYDNLERIGAAAMMNLDSLKSGDPHGNPYMFDENEGEHGGCNPEYLRYFTGDGTSTDDWRRIPPFSAAC